MDNDNITIRRGRTQSNDSMNTSFISIKSNQGCLSLPDLSTIQNIEVDELKSELTAVKLQLGNANLEIQKLKEESENMHKQIEQHQITISKLSKLYADLTGCYIDEPENNTKPQLSSNIVSPSLQKKEDNVLHASPIGEKSAITEMIDPKPNIKKSRHLRIDEPTNKKYNDEQRKQRILIVGGGQCRGLASALISSRKNSKFSHYDISSIIKPNASTEEILKSCYTNNLGQQDYVIICVGENDHNPTNYLIELSSTLKYLQKRNINAIVININYNRHLNECTLNNLIKTVCQYFPTSKYIELDHYCSRYYNHKKYLYDLSYKINIVIDSYEYNSKYLTFRNSRNYHETSCTTNRVDKDISRQKPRKGTIPFYFQKVNSNSTKSDAYTKNDIGNVVSNDQQSRTFFRSQSN